MNWILIIMVGFGQAVSTERVENFRTLEECHKAGQQAIASRDKTGERSFSGRPFQISHMCVGRRIL